MFLFFTSFEVIRFQFSTFESLTRATYDALPEFLSRNGKYITHFFCGGLAGVMATLAAQPFDVIRTRVVAQGEPKVRCPVSLLTNCALIFVFQIYKNMVHAALVMMTRESPRSLYKGLMPTLLQIAPQNAFNFGFYSLFVMMWNNFFKRDSYVGEYQCHISYNCIIIDK
jgi:solute carrier family 25 thiamine pyrophosphate transporter 19